MAQTKLMRKALKNKIVADQRNAVVKKANFGTYAKPPVAAE
jgi:hypothetical protein